jgi:hypothetical protein
MFLILIANKTKKNYNITKLCLHHAEIIQNHENENVYNIGQGKV